MENQEQLKLSEEVGSIKSEIVNVEKPDVSIFSNIKMFENAQRMAQVLIKSSLVPKIYQDSLPNTMIALEMANRVGVSPFMVMQNLDIIQGKPSWSSSFIIAVLNSCGRFKPLKFKTVGDETKDRNTFGYVAYTHDMDGQYLESPAVTWAMVNGEGWINKSGSKWKTMPELMFQYRAASFFGRLYASDILKGMQSSDEVRDFQKEQGKTTIENLE